MNPQQATVAIIEAIEKAGIPYMVVGSLSSNYYGIARSTKDADLVLALGPEGLAAVLARLQPPLRVDPQMSFETVTGTFRNIVELTDSAFTVELFHLADDAYDQERFRRRRPILFAPLGREVFLPTAEDVIVAKLRWARSKDIDDVRDVIAVQGDAIDWAYVYSWCDRHGTRPLLDEIRASIPPI